jgi:WD40 repeat protein
VVDLNSGKVIQSPKAHSHTDIILCVDVYGGLFITGSKDNSIRLWRFSGDALTCLAVHTGHNENVASVCFAPKRGHFFVSAS